LLADRGAHVRDYGAKGDGAAGRRARHPGGDRRPQDPRRRHLAVRPAHLPHRLARRGGWRHRPLQGAGFTEGPSPAQGTWLLIDTPGFTPITFTGLLARGSAMRDIAVHQIHTAALHASWAPTAYDWRCGWRTASAAWTSTTCSCAA
jgi:hypothetical protein